MNHKFLILILIGFLLAAFTTTMAQNLKNQQDTVSYLMGYTMGKNFMSAPYQFNVEQIKSGIQTAFDQADCGFSEQEIQGILEEWQLSLQQAQEKKNEADVAVNKQKGQDFLAKNKSKKGVKTTESGLQYEIIKDAKGPKPAATDKVKVHYVGTLLDGTEFDSSISRGEPISFALNMVIPGWTEGVQLMSPGAKYKFYIPSDLAYGDRAVSIIPAGSTLVFEVELIEINPAE